MAMNVTNPLDLTDILMNDLRQGEAFFSKLMVNLVKAAREKLNMDVAFISEFVSGRRVFRYVDASVGADIISVGGSDPLEQSYCQRVANGSIPELIRDAQTLPEVQDLLATKAVPVGGHLSVPIRLSNGEVFGTFCTFSRSAKPKMTARDLGLIRIFADITAAVIEENLTELQNIGQRRHYFQTLLDDDKLVLYAQPIVRLQDNKTLGYELLSRVVDDVNFSPELLFEDAERLGYAPMLGIRTIEKAIEALKILPEEYYVAWNATPNLIMECDLSGLFADVPLHRLVIEITEHDAIQNYLSVVERFKPLRERGARLAIDDTGAGYASLRHILELKPDVIKLDRSLVYNIDMNPELQALTKALTQFSQSCNCTLLAEGIETEAELKVLKSLGVTLGQGYYFSRPHPLSSLLA